MMMVDDETYKADVINPKREFTEVLCLRDYKGFKCNHVYAQLGWNNGTQVVRVSEDGDVLCLICWNTEDDKIIPWEVESCKDAVFQYMHSRKEPK